MSRRPCEIEQQIPPCRRPAPLQQADAQASARRRQAKPQGGGRRLPGQLRRTKAESGAATLARRQLQAAQAVGRQPGTEKAIQPQQGRRHIGTTQGLDTGPQRIARAARKHQVQTVQLHAGRRPGRRMGTMRRRHQQHATTGLAQPRQDRQQQAQLAQPLTPWQQFGQHPARPATAGQFGIKGGKAAGKRRCWRALHTWDSASRAGNGESIAATDLAALQRPDEGGIHRSKRLQRVAASY